MQVEQSIVPAIRPYARYLEPLSQIPKVGLAAFGVTLVAQALAVGANKLHEHQTAFDSAVRMLLHYSEESSGIFAFTAVNFILLFITIFLEGAEPLVLIRKWFVLPSFNISEHIFSLCLGVFPALTIIETLTTGNPYGSSLNLVTEIFYVEFFLFLLAYVCAATVVFFNSDYIIALQRLGKFRLPVLLIISFLCLTTLYHDYVWHFPALAPHAQ
jgi:hypothetical protein